MEYNKKQKFDSDDEYSNKKQKLDSIDNDDKMFKLCPKCFCILQGVVQEIEDIFDGDLLN